MWNVVKRLTMLNPKYKAQLEDLKSQMLVNKIRWAPPVLARDILILSNKAGAILHEHLEEGVEAKRIAKTGGAVGHEGKYQGG